MEDIFLALEFHFHVIMGSDLTLVDLDKDHLPFVWTQDHGVTLLLGAFKVIK